MHQTLSPAPDTVPAALDKRALAALAKSRNFSTEAVRLLLRAKEMILVAHGIALGAWRDSRDPVSGAFAEHCQAEIKCEELREALDIIRGRILRMPPAQRKRYTPEERFRIVVFLRTHALSLSDAAELFMVDAGTIGRWMREATREPHAETIGSLLVATPPLRTKSEVTRELVTLLDSLRVGGSKRIAQMLVRAGKSIGTETVRRYRKRRPLPAPAPDPEPELRKALALRAKEPNHIWMTDITNIPSFFKLWIFKLVVVLDVYSRYPLAFRVFSKEPASDEISELVTRAVTRFGAPKHFVTDRGPQFTADRFAATLANLGIKQRFGAIGRSGSIAIIERFWRTIKETLDVRFLPPLTRGQLEQQLDPALFWYAALRPHQGLDGATPSEVYFRLERPAANNDISPSPTAAARGPDEAPQLPFEVAYLDDRRRLPFLVPTKRAA